MNARATCGAALLLIAAMTQSTASAQWQGTNEREWGASIEADIRNGAPGDAICINALAPAQTSTDVAFKNWAYGIARQYCSADKLSAAKIGSKSDQPKTIPSACSLKVADMLRISRGAHVMVSAGNCSISFN